MVRFKDALLEHLARPGKRLILKEICEAVGIEHHRISRWHRRAGFTDWLDQAIGDATRRLANPMHLAQMHLAFNSLPHYQTQLRRLGLETPWGAPQASSDGGPQTVNGIIVNLHGLPTTTPDRTTLPPPIMRHPITGEIVPVPSAPPLPAAGEVPPAATPGG